MPLAPGDQALELLALHHPSVVGGADGYCVSSPLTPQVSERR